MNRNDAAQWEAVEEAAERMLEDDLDGAIADLTEQINVDPSNPYAFCFLGHAWFQKDEHERALKAYLGAIEIEPKYIGALVGCGQALRHMGRLDKAYRVGKQVLALEPEDPDGLYLLGTVCFARGDDKEAREYFTRFLATRPEAEVALEVEGMLKALDAQGKPTTADGDD